MPFIARYEGAECDSVTAASFHHMRRRHTERGRVATGPLIGGAEGAEAAQLPIAHPSMVQGTRGEAAWLPLFVPVKCSKL